MVVGRDTSSAQREVRVRELDTVHHPGSFTTHSTRLNVSSAEVKRLSFKNVVFYFL